MNEAERSVHATLTRQNAVPDVTSVVYASCTGGPGGLARLGETEGPGEPPPPRAP